MANAIQEAIRIVLETEGREGLDQLRKALSGVGDVSAETAADTEKLVDSIAELNERAAKATRFEALTEELEATSDAFDSASRGALQLALQIGETEKPTKEMLRAYKDVRGEVDRLDKVQRSQAATQQKLGAELRESGFDTKLLADSNRNLRTQIDGATSSLQRQVNVVEQQAGATRRQRQANEEADAAFRKMARSGQVSAAALAEYRERTEQAARSTGKLKDEAGGLSGVFGKLRGVMAPLAAFFGFREAARGISALGKVAAKAEDAQRALQNLYGTQEAGNRAYSELEKISDRNGLAFDDVVASAVRLKSFGLDPLNGSMQALIDQNAAVGGSMEQLDGKILAVGQAWAKQKLQGEEILQLMERGVPVWDLLQDATGKNVAELQRLSAAGLLGRDVIKALVDEIGRANSGAAARGLGSLSGLVQQLTARWTKFQKKVADNGVTDYFKTQIKSLLGSTTNLDQIARRVASGLIATMEAVKRFGQALVPVASLVGNTTLLLARQAGTVAAVAAAWATMRLAQWAAGFANVAGAVNSATGALAAHRAAVAATGVSGSASFAGLGARVAAYVATLRTGLTVMMSVARVAAWPLAAVTAVKLLTDAHLELNRIRLRTESLEAASRQSVRDQIKQGRELQALYGSYADTVVASSEQIRSKTQEQAEAYKFSLESAKQYFQGVIREAVAAGQQIDPEVRAGLRRINQALKETGQQLVDLSRVASSEQGLRKFATSAVEEFDNLVAKGQAAKESVSGIFNGIDFGSSKGMASALDILEQVSIRGVAAADAIKGELRKALTEVSTRDLPALQAAADRSFGAGTAAAKLFASEVDRINLTRLGVDVDAIKSGFTQAGREAVDAFSGAVDEINKLGLTAEQRAKAIAQAFDNAFKQASTQQEITALRASLQEALSDGSLGFQEFQKRIAETDVKLAELAGTGEGVGKAVAEGATQAARSLEHVGDAAEAATTKTDKTATSAKESGEAMAYGAKAGENFALSLYGVSQRAMEATMATNKLAGTQLWASALNSVTGEINAQGKALDDQIAKLQEANAEFDELGARRKELSHQYDMLGTAEIERLLQAEQQLEASRKRAADARQREQAETAKVDRDREKREGPATADMARRAGKEANAAAGAVDKMLGKAVQAAGALQAASTRVSTPGEIVIRVVSEPEPGAKALNLSSVQVGELARAVIREIDRSRRNST